VISIYHHFNAIPINVYDIWHSLFPFEQVGEIHLHSVN